MILHYMYKAMFVYNFNSGVNFLREIFFAGTLFGRDHENPTQKSQKLEPQKFSATR